MTTEQPKTTTLVKIYPQGDEAYVALHRKATSLKHYADQLQVADPEGVRAATQDLSMVANLKKALEQERKEYVDPLNSHVKDINHAFRLITDELGEADRLLRSKITAFNKRQQEIAAEVARIEKLRLEAEEAATKLAQETGQEPPPPTVPVAPLPVAAEQRTVRTELGSLSTKSIRKWRLIDFALVPDEYKKLDEPTVGKVVRAGIPSIPGIEIYSEDQIAVHAAHSPSGPAQPSIPANTGDIPF